MKGRDWYDFNWYVKQDIQPNLPHLQAALYQYGPWEGQAMDIDTEWLYHALLEKTAAIDWSEAIRDVERFLNTTEKESLKLWSKRFFTSKIEHLRSAS